MKALLIDDHPLILSALQAVIEGFDDDAHLVYAGTASAARDALAADADFDLVLLDLQLGDADGFDLLTEMRTAHPAMPVVVVSASDDNRDVTRAIFLGAMGFIPKRASNEILLDALQRILAGDIYVPPTAMRSYGKSRDGADASEVSDWGARSGSRTPPVSSPLSSLTPRQAEVLELLMKGQSNKLIARALNLSVETVKDHIAALFRAFNVNSRMQAVLAANEARRREAGAILREAARLEARPS